MGMLRRFLSNFFGKRQKPLPARIPPPHADGKPMTSHEKEIWTMMQKGVDRHWDQVARMGKEEWRGFPPGRYFRGEVLRVYGGSRMVFISPSGEWEATLKDGVVGVPWKIPD